LAPSASRLTDDEGTFLALLIRIQPATAYQLSKIYADSPVSNFGTSKGKIYPLVDRLEKRGLLKRRAVKGDARRSDWLECTARGQEAVRAWVMEIRPTHILLDDPLRTKLQSFDLLSKDEQLEWIVGAKAELQQKLEELEAYASEVTVPYKEQVHDNAVSSVRSRMEWLDRLLASIVRAKQPKK
jgi:DNA-binding PadR family transcriptional regulator